MPTVPTECSHPTSEQRPKRNHPATSPFVLFHSFGPAKKWRCLRSVKMSLHNTIPSFHRGVAYHTAGHTPCTPPSSTSCVLLAKKRSFQRQGAALELRRGTPTRANSGPLNLGKPRNRSDQESKFSIVPILSLVSLSFHTRQRFCKVWFVRMLIGTGLTGGRPKWRYDTGTPTKGPSKSG